MSEIYIFVLYQPIHKLTDKSSSLMCKLSSFKKSIKIILEIKICIYCLLLIERLENNEVSSEAWGHKKNSFDFNELNIFNTKTSAIS